MRFAFDMKELSVAEMQWYHYSIALVAIIVCYNVFNHFKMCMRLRGFKGPMALPFVGNVYSLEALFFLGYLSKLKKRYGRVFTFFGISSSYLIVAEPAAVRRILSDTKAFPKGNDYNTVFAKVFGVGLVTSKEEQHKKDKALLGKYFVRSNINSYSTMMNEHTRAMIKSELGKGGATNIEEFFACLALRVFMTFCANYNYSANPKREKEVAHIVSAGSNAVGTFIVTGAPFYPWVPGADKAYRVPREVWKDLKPVIEKRREDMAAGKCPDLDDPLTQMIKENMSESNMKDHIVTLVCAGHDTTAFFAAYMTLLLAEHRDSQEKLRDEILRVCGDKEIITADDVYEMKYMQMVMKETFRYYSIIPCVTRTCTQEVNIKECDLTLPAGQDIMIPMFLINRDPELWDEPGKFYPERFADSGDQFTSAKMGYFPFGYGTRVCIGNTLAYIETGIFMTHLLRNFILEPEIGFKPIINAGISLTTSNGVRVVLKPI